MTISSQTRTAGPFIGNGSATGGTFTFKIFNATEMTVVETSTLNVDRALVYGTDFNVSLNADQNASPGGTINYLIASVGPSLIPTGYALNATSNVPNLQAVALTNNGGFFPKVINDALDKLTILVQQLVRGVNASLKFPLSDGTSLLTELPNKTARALKAIVFDASGNVTVSTDNFNNSATAAAASAAAAAASAASATADQNGQWIYSTTTTMTNPGTGGFKLNNATIASATSIAISALTNDTGNPNLRTWLASWDDSTNTIRGTIKIAKSNTPSVFAIFNVTGTLTDNTTWLQLTLAYVTGGGVFANNDVVFISFARSGDQGGAGDFSSNTATSVDSEIVLFSGTGGKTGKRSTGSGLALLTSGVLSVTAPTLNGAMMGNGSSAPTTVAPGTSGNVLTSNGTSWASAAANAGALVLLSTQTASSSASIAFDSSLLTTTYKKYIVEMIDVVPQTASDYMMMLVSENNGGAYKTGASDYTQDLIHLSSGGALSGTGTATDVKIRFTSGNGLGNTANRGYACTLRIYNPLGTTLTKQFSAHSAYMDSAGQESIDIVSAAYIGTANAVNNIKLQCSSGNITSGIFKLYGVL